MHCFGGQGLVSVLFVAVLITLFLLKTFPLLVLIIILLCVKVFVPPQLSPTSRYYSINNMNELHLLVSSAFTVIRNRRNNIHVFPYSWLVSQLTYRISSNKSPGVYLFQSAFCPAFIGSGRLLETRHLMIIVKGGAGRSHGDL